MGKNIIFYFSGTGNSLSAAKLIADQLGDCEVFSMADNPPSKLSQKYDRIGFVYPCYFIGIPKKVKDFVIKLDLTDQKQAYIFAVATYGGTVGNAVRQLGDLLSGKGINLSYGHSLKMFSNYVVLYNMSKNVAQITNKSKQSLKLIAEDIKGLKQISAKKSNPIAKWYYNLRMNVISSMDKNFNISSACNGCGLCKKVCPVSNIKFLENRPVFQHKCEQCVACIQFCPQKAINYKNVTQKRGRYTNPDIGVKDFIAHMNNEK